MRRWPRRPTGCNARKAAAGGLYRLCDDASDRVHVPICSASGLFCSASGPVCSFPGPMYSSSPRICSPSAVICSSSGPLCSSFHRIGICSGRADGRTPRTNPARSPQFAERSTQNRDRTRTAAGNGGKAGARRTQRGTRRSRSEAEGHHHRGTESTEGKGEGSMWSGGAVQTCRLCRAPQCHRQKGSACATAAYPPVQRRVTSPSASYSSSFGRGTSMVGKSCSPMARATIRWSHFSCSWSP